MGIVTSEGLIVLEGYEQAMAFVVVLDYGDLPAPIGHDTDWTSVARRQRQFSEVNQGQAGCMLCRLHCLAVKAVHCDEQVNEFFHFSILGRRRRRNPKQRNSHCIRSACCHADR